MGLAFFLAGSAWSFVDTVSGEYVRRDFDQFIDKAKPVIEGSSTMIKPHNIRFDARVQTLPDKRAFSDVFVVLKAFNINPIPEISHRMFIRSEKGRIIAAYVEDRVVSDIRSTLVLEDQVEFKAYHVYNHDDGPAVVIVGFTKL